MSALARAITRLRDAYPDQTFGDRAVVVYAEQLADLDENEVEAAVIRLVNTSRYIPRISEIRREVVETELGLPAADEAWEMVLRNALERGGVELPDVARRALKAVGGPWAVRHSENPGTLYAQFRKHYEGIREAEIRRVAAGSPITAEQLKPGRAPVIPPAVAEPVGDTPISLAARKLAQIPESTSIVPKRPKPKNPRNPGVRRP